MDQQLKERLVGAIVLSLLVVIFVPLAFDERVQPVETGSIATDKTSVAVTVRHPDPRPETANEIMDADKRKIDNLLPAVGNKPVWVVQVGSFSTKNNALALRSKLRKKGFSTIIQDSKGGTGMIYRVRVGPFSGRTEAEKALQQLQQKLSLEGMVLSLPKMK